MPFAARIGFRAVFTGAAPTEWYDLTAAEVAASFATWTGTTGPSLVSQLSPGGAPISGDATYRSGCVGADGNIYYAPAAATANILVVYQNNSAIELRSFGLTGLGSGVKFFHATLAPNGKIYCPPFNTNKVLIIDPATETTVLTDFGITFTGSLLYNTSILGPDGKIYCLGKDLLVIDPVANTATKNAIVASSATAFRWWTGVRATANDLLYFCPYANLNYLIIDAVSNTATTNNFGAVFGASAHQGMVNAPNGKLYSPPFDQPYWSILDPVANTYARVTQNNAKGTGSVLAPDGNIYQVPFQQGANSRYAVFDPVSNTASLQNYGLSLGSGSWGTMVMNQNGNCYSIPATAGNSHFLVLTVPGTGLNDPDFANIVKTSFINVGGS